MSLLIKNTIFWITHHFITLVRCIDFLHSKFGDVIISKNTEHHWPPYSPDWSPLDFNFWGQTMAHEVRTKPSTLEELKGDVEDFTRNFDSEKPGGWPGTSSTELSCACLWVGAILNT